MLPQIHREGSQHYRRCVTTVMDTTDPDITFDSNGECNYVRDFRSQVLPSWSPDGNAAELGRLFDRIRDDGKGRDYDCAVGLSGGVDSSYVAYLAWKHGLRVLAVHTDTGWNSEVAVGNIEQIVRRCGFDLVTRVVYWPEMRDLQTAFLRARVQNQDIPQDHAIFAAFYSEAVRRKVRWVLNGSNHATECVLPPAWGYDAGDVRHLLAIHRRFGKRPLKAFPLMGHVHHGFLHRMVAGLRIAKPLNLVPYSRGIAVGTLRSELGWRDYGGKHQESRFTKFFQTYYLPTRYGYDKRLAHLSSLILSGELTRVEALDELSRPLCTPQQAEHDIHFIRTKLELGEDEMAELLDSPPRSHAEFPRARISARRLWKIGKKLSLLPATPGPSPSAGKGH